MKDATIEATKKTLSTANRAFVKFPSATNWRALEEAMLDYQSAHQSALADKRYSKVIAQTMPTDADYLAALGPCNK